MLRRTVLTGLAGSAVIAAAPRFALASTTAITAFRILRDGSDVGRHSLTARLADGRFDIDIDIDIVVRVIGIPAYRYELVNREVWQDGQLMSLDSRTNDDGDKHSVSVRREGGKLVVDGSEFDGEAAPDATTTSYYARPFLDRRPWISTQTGRPLDISVTPNPAPRYAIGGDLQTVLIYDDAGDWVGCEFDAGGEPARYEVTDRSGSISGLWAGA